VDLQLLVLVRVETVDIHLSVEGFPVLRQDPHILALGVELLALGLQKIPQLILDLVNDVLHVLFDVDYIRSLALISLLRQISLLLVSLVG